MPNVVNITIKGEDQASQAFGNLARTAKASLDDAGSRVNRFSDKLASMRLPLLAAGGTLVGLGGISIKAASDLEQSIGAIDSIFGEAADSIHQFAQTSVEDVGLSRRALNEAVVPMGAMMQNLGLSADEAADNVLQLTGVASDMAAAFGGTVTGALNALGAALRGEADPAERFGLSLKVSDVNARAMALGLAESESAISKNARAAAFMSLVMEQTNKVQGQFAREAGTVAVQWQKVQARFEDVRAELGTNLLPAATKVLDVLNKLLTWFGNLPDDAKTVALVLGAVSAGFIGIALVIPPAISLMTAFGVASNLALAGIPALIGAIVTGVTLLILKWDEVKRFMEGAGGWILAAFGPIGVAAKLVIDNWEAVQSAVVKTVNFLGDVVNRNIEMLNEVIRAINKVVTFLGRDAIPEIKFRLGEWSGEIEMIGSDHEDLADRVGSATEEMIGNLGKTGTAWKGLADDVEMSTQRQQDLLFEFYKSEIQNSQNAEAVMTAQTKQGVAERTAARQAEFNEFQRMWNNLPSVIGGGTTAQDGLPFSDIDWSRSGADAPRILAEHYVGAGNYVPGRPAGGERSSGEVNVSVEIDGRQIGAAIVDDAEQQGGL